MIKSKSGNKTYTIADCNRSTVTDPVNSCINLFKAIGPGILVACAAIGGSHLV